MPLEENLILCGFMGCGKSTVGRLLAKRTGRRFVDMDEYIEGKAGRRVPEIFAAEGEEGFRRRERGACAALAAETGLVIAAGGGALTFPANVGVLSATGCIVLLDVPLPVILRRLEGDVSRPLLARPDKEAAAAALLERRLPLYRAAARLTVDGSAAPDEVAAAVLRAWNNTGAALTPGE